MAIFKKKEWLTRLFRKLNHPVLKSKPREIRYGKFLESWSKQFNKGFPVFVGLLATIFITLLTKDVSVPTQDIFSYILTYVFALVVLESILVSVIVGGILYLIVVFGFGSLVHILNKTINKIQVRFGSFIVLFIIILLVGLGYFITSVTKTLTSFWVIGLLIESIGVIVGLHIITHYLSLFHNEGKWQRK